MLHTFLYKAPLRGEPATALALRISIESRPGGDTPWARGLKTSKIRHGPMGYPPPPVLETGLRCLGGRTWVVLEASWRGFGGVLGRLGGQHGSKLLPKTRPKSIKNRSQNWLIFWCLLRSVFGWIFIDFWCKNGAKLVPKWQGKSMLTSKGDFSKNRFSHSISIFHRFWYQLASIFHPKIY